MSGPSPELLAEIATEYSASVYIELQAMTKRAGQAEAALDRIREAVEAAGDVMAVSPKDWSARSDDAWLYGLINGWDCEQPHTHDPDDPDCINALDETAERHGWTPDTVTRLRRLRAAVAALAHTEETR